MATHQTGIYFQLAGQRWTAPRGKPDTEFLSLNAKLRDADPRVEALDWLRPTERLRLLGDRVSRAVAFKLARQLDLDAIGPAEYLAVASLQSDALVTDDPALRAAADGIVPLARFEDLTS